MRRLEWLASSEVRSCSVCRNLDSKASCSLQLLSLMTLLHIQMFPQSGGNRLQHAYHCAAAEVERMSRKVDRLMTGMPNAFLFGDGQSVKLFACLCMVPVRSTRGDNVLFKQISLKLMKGQTGSPVLAHKEWSSRSSQARLEYGQDPEDISSGAGVPALFHAKSFCLSWLERRQDRNLDLRTYLCTSQPYNITSLPVIL